MQLRPSSEHDILQKSDLPQMCVLHLKAPLDIVEDLAISICASRLCFVYAVPDSASLLVKALSEKEQLKCIEGRSEGIPGSLQKPALCNPPPPGDCLAPVLNGALCRPFLIGVFPEEACIMQWTASS